MTAWRGLVGVLAVLAAASLARADDYLLKEDLKVGDCFRVRLVLTLDGELRVTRGDKAEKIALAAEATHEFPERILSVADGVADRAVRVYETAKATVRAGGDRSEKGLRPERRLFVAQRQKDVPLVYSPAGPLTREELELTAEHFDTLAVTGLLPGRSVAVGDTWKLSSFVAQALCHFEGLAEHDLTGKLEEVKDDIARVSLTGSAQGIELGAVVKLKATGSYTFDLKQARLTTLEWKQSDEREQGPASPALAATATTTLTRTKIERPEALAEGALVSVPADFKVPDHLTGVEYRDAKGRFDFVCARDWQLVGAPNGRFVLRLMDRGDFVAQATLTPWTAAPKGRRLSDDEFKAAMARTPGWEPEKELQAGDVPAGDGRTIYRLSQLGKMDGVEVMQNFFLIAAASGEQVVLAVTLTPKKAEQLGSKDLALAGSVDFPRKP